MENLRGSGRWSRAVEIVKKACPDLAILDIQMPRLTGLEAAKEVPRYCSGTIFLSDRLHDVSLFAGILQDTGIKGFVCKPRMERDLVPTVEAILKRGDSFPALRSRIIHPQLNFLKGRLRLQTCSSNS
jgi:DNA-binding response OmpR family regulator